MKRIFYYIFVITICLFIAGCSVSGSPSGDDSSRRDSSRKDKKETTEYRKIYSAEHITEYLGVRFDPDAPFTYQLNGVRYFTDKNGKLLNSENKGSERTPFPDKSDYCGKLRCTSVNDEGQLIDKSGNVVYRYPETSFEAHEFRNGRVVYKCDSRQHSWLVDENGTELTDTEGTILSLGPLYYIARDSGRNSALYDADGNILFQGTTKTSIGLKAYASVGDYYLWVNDTTNYALLGGGDFSVYRLPEMTKVFYAEKVDNYDDYNTGVTFALVAGGKINNSARVVAIYDGKVTVDTVMAFDQNITVKGNYAQKTLMVYHDSWNWVYTTYNLQNGAFISENAYRTPAGDVDEEKFDYKTTDTDRNNGAAIRLGVDITSYSHPFDYAWQMPFDAEKFNYFEKETGRRLFCNFLGNGFISIVDDNTGDAIIIGRTLYADVPEHENRTTSIFAYATDNEGKGRLMNLATGKALNVAGEFVGFQTVYAVFKEDEAYRVYNFDLDSFVIGSDGSSKQDSDYSRLKKHEPEYNVKMPVYELGDEKPDYSEVVENIKKIAVKEMKSMKLVPSDYNIEDDDLNYTIVRSSDIGDGEYAYWVSFGIYRLFSTYGVIYPNGQFYKDEKYYESYYQKYRNYFSFDITSMNDFDRMKSDPSYYDSSVEAEKERLAKLDPNNPSENLTRWQGTYVLSQYEYIEVLNVYIPNQVYFIFHTTDAEGFWTANEYLVDCSNELNTEIKIPYQADIYEILKLEEDGISVYLDNGMQGANDGFYKRQTNY